MAANYTTPRALVMRAVLAVVGVIVLYICCVGIFSPVCGFEFKKPAISPDTDAGKAAYMSEALIQPLDRQLNGFFGWLPNDLFGVPYLIDNKVNFQRGIIYATRSGSDVLSHRIARYGERDTVPAILVDATMKHFAYADNVWGWWYLYSTETQYKRGVEVWREWAAAVGQPGSKQICNMTTDDVVSILNWAFRTMDYCLGILNDESISHFQSDDVIYYIKGVSWVVSNVLDALVDCDKSIRTRGGTKNVDECKKRFQMISQFNPILCVAGSNGVGDSFWPNHIASLARHVDVVGNRLSDIRNAMEK